MYIKQIYTGCLSEAAYFVESKGEAVVIDPLRDTDAYLKLAKEQNASIKYDTIQNKILPLADDIIVYPAHGPGSSCGKNLGPDTFSTIGEQKKTNYALQPQTREEFITAVTSGLADAPVYFAINAKINK